MKIITSVGEKFGSSSFIGRPEMVSIAKIWNGKINPVDWGHIMPKNLIGSPSLNLMHKIATTQIHQTVNPSIIVKTISSYRTEKQYSVEE